MKPITKIIIFLIIAFALVVIITFVARTAVTPTTETPPVASVSPLWRYTTADVMKHNISSDCWTIVDGSVYDLTPFTSKHPGGVENITKICGIDGTKAFEAQHGTAEAPQAALANLKIGTLSK